MVDDALDAFEGIRTIRYFTYLLVFVVCAYVIGVLLSATYEITALEWFFGYFVQNPMVLFPIAGILAFAMLAYLLIASQ